MVMPEHTTTPEIKVPTSGRALQVLALFVFLGVGSLVSLPCLHTGGSTRGLFTMTVLILAFFRLGWSVYKRTFRYRDYMLYLAVVIAFGLWADAEQER
jgi:hypothetical protein